MTEETKTVDSKEVPKTPAELTDQEQILMIMLYSGSVIIARVLGENDQYLVVSDPLLYMAQVNQNGTINMAWGSVFAIGCADMETLEKEFPIRHDQILWASSVDAKVVDAYVNKQTELRAARSGLVLASANTRVQ